MKHAFAFAVTAAVLSISSPVFAADSVPSNPNILTTLQLLQQNEAQQTSILQGIQTALQGLIPTVSNAVSTPLIPLTTAPGVTQTVSCSVTNVSSESRTVAINIYGFGATPVF